MSSPPTEDRLREALPPPAVAPGAYTESYYRDACMGAEVWARSEGAPADPMYPEYARLASVAEGEAMVDIGCGRGELLVAALERGAARAIGIEYAPAAVELARRTLEARGAGPQAQVLEADARAVPLPDARADLVTLLDVVEHLSPAELDRVLAEAMRILRPGGRLFIHTMPNRLIYTLTYPALRAALRRRRTWPAEPRSPFEQSMHVNEQSLWSLRRVLRRAGFTDARVTLGRFVHTAHLPEESAQTWVHRLAAHRVTALLGCADLWARATRPPE